MSSAPEGAQWLTQFFQACGGCTFDFIPLHWYGDGSQYFEQYVQNFHNQFGKPVWVTEWASTNGDPNGKLADEDKKLGILTLATTVALSFLKDTTAFLDSTSYVERYSWFAFEVFLSMFHNALHLTLHH